MINRSTLYLCFFFFVSALQAENPYQLPDGLYTEITTERGVVVGELFYKKMPMTVANHVGLAEGTLGPSPRKPFYNGLTWCRVVPDLVVQGGDPTATGNGDAGYLFPDEIVPGLRHNATGTIQMGNDGPDTNGSQFCLMLSPQHRLNYQHNVFGRVVRGLDLLPKIRQGDTMQVKILRLGPDAQAFKSDEATFNNLVAHSSRYQGPREPGPDSPFDDPSHLLPTEWDRAKNFNFKLVNFQRFTGTRIVARIYPSPPTTATLEKLQPWLASEAARLSVAQRGALAVYFANDDRWLIHIGSDSIPRFLQTGPNGESATPSPSLPNAITELLAAAKIRSNQAIDAMIKRLPPTDPITEARKIKLRTDAVIDALIFKLEPASN
ncbi:MAG: peptidylprolyl isomerase [Verrucomicrobiota bacterium]